MRSPTQKETPVQPVNKPILCSPFKQPTAHWVYNTQTGEASQMSGRRPASHWFKTERIGSARMQLGIVAEEEREDVRRWRKSGYEDATQATKQLRRHGQRDDRARLPDNPRRGAVRLLSTI